jgi:hypothetical protein
MSYAQWRNSYTVFFLFTLGSKARPTRKADNLTAIFEPTV